jgi:hypothetical protein
MRPDILTTGLNYNPKKGTKNLSVSKQLKDGRFDVIFGKPEPAKISGLTACVFFENFDEGRRICIQYFPYCRSVSHIAMKFSTGTSLWTL